MKRIRWGILSTAKIGVEKVVPALQRSELGQVIGMASRDESRAADVAQRLEIPRSYGTYDALLDDRDVDAVYAPLPNHLHVPWAIRALERGKHVLCEKPIGLSADEAEALAAVGKRFPDRKLMEAFMYRHHPQCNHRIRKCHLLRPAGLTCSPLRGSTPRGSYHSWSSGTVSMRSPASPCRHVGIASRATVTNRALNRNGFFRCRFSLLSLPKRYRRRMQHHVFPPFGYIKRCLREVLEK